MRMVPVGFWRAPGQQNEFIANPSSTSWPSPPARIRCGTGWRCSRRRQDPPRSRSSCEGRRLGQRRCRQAFIAGLRSPTASAALLPWSPRFRSARRARCTASSSPLTRATSSIRTHVARRPKATWSTASVPRQENNVRDGRVVESNFDDFPLPGIAEMPKVETVLVPTGGFWGGHGEPAILPLALSVARFPRHRKANPLVAAQAPRSAERVQR